MNENLKFSKLTKQRQMILDVLHDSNHAITIYELVDKISAKYGYDMVLSTMYRNINLLNEKGAISKTFDDDGVALYFVNEHVHSHTLECQNCHKIVVIDNCPFEAFQNTIAKETGFVINKHDLSFNGYCHKCSKL